MFFNDFIYLEMVPKNWSLGDAKGRSPSLFWEQLTLLLRWEQSLKVTVVKWDQFFVGIWDEFGPKLLDS